jgi:dihydrolipoamide dehydrogenase
VIGSGQGGNPLAQEQAAAGKSVVLFESGAIGGTCVNVGCTPSKAFLASAHNAAWARSAQRLGIHADVRVDFGAVSDRVRGLIGEFRGGVVKRLDEAGVRVVHARARFTAPRTVAGGDVEVTAPHIVIDTGCRPTIPPIPGLHDVPFLTNENVFELLALPESLAVIGGGYIGLELGQGFARLGSRVTIVNSSDRVLEREEPDVSAALAAALLADGVKIRNATTVERVERAGAGIALVFSGGDRIEYDALLVATGRAPSTGDLDVAASGIALDKHGFVACDEYLRTTCEGVYAIGDCAGQPQFTHVSWEDHRRIDALLRGAPRKRDDRVLAYAVFTDPQVGRAGLTVQQAQAAGIDARAETLPVASIARGIEWMRTDGFYRIVVDQATDRIVGATCVGDEASELVHVLLAHIEDGRTWRDLAQSMYVHPTYAEGLPTLARLFDDDGEYE